MKAALNERGLWLFAVPALVLLTLLFLLPMAAFMLQSVTGQDDFVAGAGTVLASPPVRAALLTTNLIALEVTAIVLVIGYPVALYLTRATGWRVALVIFCVVAPTLVSTIVRTFSLMVLGGRQGVINRLLQTQLGLVGQPLQLLYNRGAVVVAMAYVLLPFMVITLYTAMRTIDRNLLQAAKGMGASETTIFIKVFFPLSLPGVVSGCLMVFIQSLGYYLTPALVGGPRDVMLAQLIQRTMDTELDWSSASVMSLVLVGTTLLLFAVYGQVAPVGRLTGARP